MLLQANSRLKVYSSIAFFALLMLLMEIPIADTGTWLGILCIIGIAVWIELGDYFSDDEDDDADSER